MRRSSDWTQGGVAFFLNEIPHFFGSFCHARCQRSLENLLIARMEIWRGALSPGHRRLWTQARSQIPSWPGFRRLEEPEGALAEVRETELYHLECLEAEPDYRHGDWAVGPPVYMGFEGDDPSREESEGGL